MRLKSLYVALLMSASGSALAVNCNSFPSNTITGFVNDDVLAVGYNCVIGPNAFVNGNVTQSGIGSVIVRGRINGGVMETGDGSISVIGGNVQGEVSEADAGGIVVRGGGSVEGELTETLAGNVDITVQSGSVLKGNIIESGLGSVSVITASGDFEGSIEERDAGNVTVTVDIGTFFKGDLVEDLGGSVSIEVNGTFEGNASEFGAGNLNTFGVGLFKGNSEHELPGTCTNSITRFEGAPCNPL